MRAEEARFGSPGEKETKTPRRRESVQAKPDQESLTNRGRNQSTDSRVDLSAFHRPCGRRRSSSAAAGRVERERGGSGGGNGGGCGERLERECQAAEWRSPSRAPGSAPPLLPGPSLLQFPKQSALPQSIGPSCLPTFFPVVGAQW